MAELNLEPVCSGSFRAEGAFRLSVNMKSLRRVGRVGGGVKGMNNNDALWSRNRKTG